MEPRLHFLQNAGKIVTRNIPILVTPDNHDVPYLEAEIDKFVYKLYDLTPEEIKIVEGGN